MPATRRVHPAKAIAVGIALAASGVAAQTPQEIGPDRWGAAGALLASVERVVTLLERPTSLTVPGFGPARGELRVSIVVIDLGPPIGLAPRQALHLAAFKEVDDVGVAWALVPVAEVLSFDGAAELTDGIYEIDADVIAGPARPDCEIERALFRLDARQLLARVAQARGLRPGTGLRLRAPVEVVRRSVVCRDP
ncbi:MAG: hypothetical protein ACFBRM_15365 [Pikeienuella sp.]